MTNDSFADWIELRLEREHYVAQPGKTISIPVELKNQGAVVDHLEFSVEGIPPEWLGSALPVVMLPPGEQRQVNLVIQPPAAPPVRAGVYPMLLRVASLRLQARFVEVSLILTVAAVYHAGVIGAYLAQSEFSVRPGQKIAFPLILVNRGLQEDQYLVSLQGMPPGWCAISPAQVLVQPGDEAEITVSLTPPYRPESRAGKHPFSLVVVSKENLSPPVNLPCQISVAPFYEYRLDLLTPSILPGEIGIVSVRNLGNSPDFYTLQFSHPRNALEFYVLAPAVEPLGAHREAAEKPHLSPWGVATAEGCIRVKGENAGAYRGLLLHIPPGEKLTLEFIPSARKPPAWQERLEPFVVTSESARLERKQQEGVAVISPVAYPWLVRVVLGLFLIAVMASFVLLGALIWGSRPSTTLAGPTQTIPVVPWAFPLTQIPVITPTLPPPLITATATSVPATATDTATIPPGATTLPTASSTLIVTLIPATPTEIPPSVTPAVTVPVFPIQNLGRLAIESNLEGRVQIYSYDTRTLQFTLLHAQAGPGIQPAWSPDGRRLAFATDREGQYEVYVLNLDNGVVFNLTNHPANDFEPAWSPDGQKIVFTSNRDGNLEIYVADLGTQQAVNLTRHPADDSQPDWFLDQRIAFTSDRDGNAEIYMMNPDGTGQYNFSNHPANDSQPAGARDGSALLFVSDRDRNLEIYAMGLDGSNQVNLTNNPGSDEHPAWSPDNQWIAFSTDRNGNWEIYVMKRDGSQPFNLTSLPTQERYPAWTGNP